MSLFHFLERREGKGGGGRYREQWERLRSIKT